MNPLSLDINVLTRRFRIFTAVDAMMRTVEVRRPIGFVTKVVSVDKVLTTCEDFLIFAKRYGASRVHCKERIQKSLAS